MKKLERKLNLKAVIAISISAMLGSGIFVLPGIGVNLAGNGLWLAFLLAAICILPAALSKSELATAMPTSGGTYVYLERTFGPLVGTVTGLGLWLSLLLKSSFALIGFGAYLSILTDVPLQFVTLCVLAVLMVLNILGVGKVSSVLIGIVSISIGLLAYMSVASLFHLPTSEVSLILPLGTDGLIAATALVFVSFAGVTKVAAIAEEIIEPEKNLPKGIIISLTIVTVIYCLVSFLLTYIVPISELENNLKPLYTMSKYIGGSYLQLVTALIAILTMSSMANSGILAASRFPFAMARDKLLPTELGIIHSRFLTPVMSIVISSIVVAFIVTNFNVAKIAKLASAFMIIIYMIENLAVIILHEARVQWYKPSYRSPLYPFVQIFGIITSGFLLVQMGLLAVTAIVSIAIPGIILYMLYSRKRTDRRGVIGIRGYREDLEEKNLKIKDMKSRVNDIMDLSVNAKVVIPLFGKERSPEMLIEMGIALAEHSNVEVTYFTEIPEQTDLDDIHETPAFLKSLQRRVFAMAKERDENIAFDPIVTRDVTKSIFSITQKLHCEWLVMEWGGKGRGHVTVNNPIGWLRNHLPCNLAVFRDAGVRYIRKILVFVNKDKNDKLVLSTADHLARVHNANITLCEWMPNIDNEQALNDEKEILKGYQEQLSAKSYINILTGQKRKIDALVGATVEYDLFICGASEMTFLSTLTGSFEDKLTSKSACSVLSVQTYEVKK